MNVPLGRIFGTEIRAHWSWIPVLAFIAVVLSLDLTAGGASDWPASLAWGASIATAALVFASVTAHELAHVAVARRNGMEGPVAVIQLLGGTFVMEVAPRTPGQELRTALAGPALSLAVTATLGAFATLLTYGPIDIDRAPQGLQAIQFVTVMVCVFNGFLAFVNLIPGYPMDGARILHALAWRRTGQEAAANEAAVRAGRYIGRGFMVAGVLGMIFVDLSVGLAVMVAGWLIIGSSRLLDRRIVIQEAPGRAARERRRRPRSSPGPPPAHPRRLRGRIHRGSAGHGRPRRARRGPSRVDRDQPDPPGPAWVVDRHADGTGDGSDRERSPHRRGHGPVGRHGDSRAFPPGRAPDRLVGRGPGADDASFGGPAGPCEGRGAAT